LKCSPPPFFIALEVLKEKSKKMNMISREEDQNLSFSTDFELFYRFGKLRKKLIDKLFNRFFVNFSSIYMVLASKGC
jgi:hypothetical protein